MRASSSSVFSRRLGAIVAGLFSAALAGAAEPDLEAQRIAPGVRMNHVQVIGTHNSYHLEPSAEASAWRTSAAVRQAMPRLAAMAVEYSHRPLIEQLETQQVRQLEIDVFPSEDGVDFPVRHLPVFDDQTTVSTLGAALAEIAVWSGHTPHHVPILVQIELKVAGRLTLDPSADPALLRRMAAQPTPGEWTDEQLRRLDALIRRRIPPAQILRPTDVRGSAASLRSAIAERGWPLLDTVRGRLWFALDNEGAVRDRYLRALADESGRALFVSVPPDHPEAAWMKLNDAVTDFALIQQRVRAGFIVRTRSDIELVEPRANDPTRRDRALASGAHVISTDFPAEDPRYPGFVVRLPGGVAARPNPVVPPPAPGSVR